MSPDPQLSTADEIRDFLTNSPEAPSVAEATAVRDWVAQQVLSDPQVAFEIAQGLRDQTERSELLESRAVGWRCFGDASLYQGRFHEARDAYELATKFARDGHAPGLLGQILVSRIGVLSMQGKADEAAGLVGEAEARLAEAGDRPYIARLHMNLGNAAFYRSEFQEAYEHFSRSDREFKSLGISDGMTLGLRINLGVACYSALSKVDEAREIFREVELECSTLGLHHLEAQAKFNRAHLESMWGNYREAIALLETAEEMFASVQAPELIAATQLTRAEAFIDLGMPDEAIDLARRAGDSYRGCDLDVDAALADQAQARALRSEGRSTEARELLERVRDYYEDTDLPVGAAIASLEIARTTRDDPQVMEDARIALDSLAEKNMFESLARGRIAVAETFRRTGSPELAEAELAPAFAAVSKLRARDRIDLWTVAGRVARDAGRRGVALRRYRRAVSEVERDRHLTPGAELKARATGTEADRELIDLLLDSTRLEFENLYRLVESIHGRRWRNRGTEQAGGVEWSRRRAELASLVRQVQKREAEEIASSSSDRAALEPLRAEIERVESEILSSVRTEFFQKTSLPTVPGSFPDSRELRESLRTGQVLLEYFDTGKRIVCLIASAASCRYQILDSHPSEVRSRVRDWQMQLESFALLAHRGAPNLDFHRLAADHLLEGFGSNLLEPLAADFDGADELIIVPHAALHLVPFEALRIGGDYIDRRFRVRRLPSSGLLARRLESGGSTTDVVLAAVQNGPPESESEGRAVARRLGVEVVIDPTGSEVLEALETARHVHWSAHAVFRADNPLFSHLAAIDGGFFLADLRGQRLRVRRLVLSACDTGKVVSGRSDDAAGVALAFLEAGVGELVSGLWRLHDVATVQFMENFYEALDNEEQSTASALQVAYARTRDTWNHPFYWGGIAVYG